MHATRTSGRWPPPRLDDFEKSRKPCAAFLAPHIRLHTASPAWITPSMDLLGDLP
jgi:hypothetical protein